MEEDKLGETITRGHQADEILNHPLFKDAKQYLDQFYVDVWKAAKSTEAREKCWYAYWAAQEFIGHFQKVASDGRLADRQIQEMIRRKKRAA